MDILFGKSMWGAEDLGLEGFLERTRESGFDAAEINLAAISEEPDDVKALLRERDLALVAQLVVEGDSAREQHEFLDRWFPVALAHAPLLINLHTGRDFFSFEENLELIQRVAELGETHGVLTVQETHRGRAFYSAIETKRYLEACPGIRLNADFSHWMNVHESDLRNQPATMALAIRHSRYIHARVGYEEGPQVTHPGAMEWRGHLENHLALWRRIIATCQEDGMERLVITPEFGPVPYMHTFPFINEPVADAWEVNEDMLEILQQEFQNLSP